jgi:hypothetical protein
MGSGGTERTELAFLEGEQAYLARQPFALLFGEPFEGALRDLQDRVNIVIGALLGPEGYGRCDPSAYAAEARSSAPSGLRGMIPTVNGRDKVRTVYAGDGQAD